MVSKATDAQVQKVLQLIENSGDAKQLSQLAENARRLGQPEVHHAALLRLYEILPSAKPGTLEHDVWRSIYALEGALKDERGKTILLSRTRQKIARDGEHKTVSDLVCGKAAEGFHMLIARKMPELTFEAVALRNADKFDEAVISAANDRLLEFNIDPLSVS